MSTVNIIPKQDIIHGSNTNGSYVKFPDGLMICWKLVSKTGVKITNAWGSFYESTSSISLGSWPVTFTAAPTVFLSVAHTNSGITAYPEQPQGVTASSCGTTYAASPTSSSSAALAFTVIGIGYWK